MGCVRRLRHLSINIDRPRPSGKRRPRRRITDQFPDARRLLRTDTADLSQGGRISAQDTFDGSEVTEQSMRESGTNAWKSLEQEQPS